MTDNEISSPFRGPTPYRDDGADAAVFFGRDREKLDLQNLIGANSFVILYSQSGAGKSSLINAGIRQSFKEAGDFELLPTVSARDFDALHDAETRALVEQYNPFSALTLRIVMEDDKKWRQLASSQKMLALSTYMGMRPGIGSEEEGLHKPRLLIFDQLEHIFTAYPEYWFYRDSFFIDIADAVLGTPRFLRELRPVAPEDMLAQPDVREPEATVGHLRSSGSLDLDSYVLQHLINPPRSMDEVSPTTTLNAVIGKAHPHELADALRQLGTEIDDSILKDQLPRTTANRLLLQSSFPTRFKNLVARPSSTHVLFALREEFLGDLINHVHQVPLDRLATYRLERLNDLQAREALTKPFQARKRTIEGNRSSRIQTITTNLRRQSGSAESVPGQYVEPVHLQIIGQRLWDEGFGTDDETVEEESQVDTTATVDSALVAYYESSVRQAASYDSIYDIRAFVRRHLISNDRTRSHVPVSSSQRRKRVVGWRNIWRSLTYTWWRKLLKIGDPEISEETIKTLAETRLVSEFSRGPTDYIELSHDRFVGPIDEYERTETKQIRDSILSFVWGGTFVAIIAGIIAAGAILGNDEESMTQDRDLAQEVAAATDAEKDRALLLAVENQIRDPGPASLNLVQVVLDTNPAMLHVAPFPSEISDVFLREDGTILVGLRSGLVVEHRLGDRVALATDTEDRTHEPSDLVIGHSGGLYMFAVDNSIWISDIATGSLRGSVGATNLPKIEFLEISANGQRLMSADVDGGIWIRRTEDPSLPGVHFGTEKGIYLAALNEDGTLLATASEDGTSIWDVGSGESSWRISEMSPTTSLAFGSESALLAFGSMSGSITLLSTANGEELGKIEAGRSGTAVTSVALNPESSLIAAGFADGRIELWDIPTASQIGTGFSGHAGDVRILRFDPHGEFLLSAGSDHRLITWDVKQYRFRPFVKSFEGTPFGFAERDIVLDAVPINRGRQHVAVTESGRVLVWDLDRGAVINDVSMLMKESPTRIAFNRSTNWLAASGCVSAESQSACQQSWVEVYDVEASTRVSIGLQGPPGEIASLEFAPDGSLLAAASGPSVYVWNLAEPGAGVPRLLDHGLDVTSVAISGNGELLVAGSEDKIVTVWDISTGSRIDQLAREHGDAVTAVATDPTGTRVVSGSADRTVVVWDKDDNVVEPRTLTGFRARLTAVAISDDGALVAAGTESGEVAVWDADSGQRVGKVAVAHAGPVVRLGFSAPSTEVISVGADATFVVRAVDLASAPARACSVANRSLTSEEWASVFPDEQLRDSCQDASDEDGAEPVNSSDSIAGDDL